MMISDTGTKETFVLKHL